MRAFRLLIILFVTLTWVTGPFLIAHAQTTGNSEIDALNQQIELKKKRIAELEKAMSEYNDKISKTRLEAVSLKNQLSLLDNHIAQVELDVETTQEKLDTVKLQIQGLDISIADKNKAIERQKAILAELLRNLQQEQDKSYVEIMAGYDNFSDFFNRVQYLNKVQQDLGLSAKNLRLAKEELQEKHQQAEERQRAYNELQEELKGKKTDLEGQSQNKQNLLVQTQSSELKYKALVNSLKTQYQQTEGEISGIERQVRAKVEAAQKKNPEEFDNSGSLSWPIASRRVTAYFNDPGYPYRTIFEHNAIDIGTGQGSVVKAASSGYVARAKRCTSASCYAYVMIVHADGISTVYGHLSAISVAEDQFVTRGDVIGYSGATPGTVGAGPFTTGPHLHFEVRKNGIPVNPLNYLK